MSTHKTQKPKLSDAKNLTINGEVQDALGKKVKLAQTGRRFDDVLIEAQRKKGIKLP